MARWTEITLQSASYLQVPGVLSAAARCSNKFERALPQSFPQESTAKSLFQPLHPTIRKVTPKLLRHHPQHPALAPPSSNRRCGRGPDYQMKTRLQRLALLGRRWLEAGQTASRPFGNTFNVMAPLAESEVRQQRRMHQIHQRHNGCSQPVTGPGVVGVWSFGPLIK